MTDALLQAINTHLADKIIGSKVHVDELTIELDKQNLLQVAELLRDHDDFQFEQLIDLCGVDYLTYGQAEWTTESATLSGFERGRNTALAPKTQSERRFAVVYHLLSITLNHRLRLKVYIDEEDMKLPSVIGIWNGANWFEREAFDLFGLLFEGHPDLRRILTDYGFIGHPFRKDFPVIGELEMRYDEDKKECIYQPVTIEERVLVARVIRKGATEN